MQQHQRDRLAGRRGLPTTDIPPPGHTPGPGREHRSTRSRSPEGRFRHDPIDVDALPTYSESEEARRRKEYVKSKKRERRNEKKVQF